MSSQSEKLKVIFFEPASDTNPGRVVADGYFSFVPTFKEGESINMTLTRKEAATTPIHDPIGHKTHRIVKTDWVLMIDPRTKEALATMVVSVEKIDMINKMADESFVSATPDPSGTI